jgi:RHS repeat-associated protein
MEARFLEEKLMKKRLFLQRGVVVLHCLLVLAGMAAASLATACPETPGATCNAAAASPAGQALGTSVNLGVGNPINVINGNKYQREDDMPALPGVLGLEIVRHYNSQHSTPGTWTGRVGRGWRLSYETRLVVAPRSIQVLQADGASVIFVRDALRPSIATTDNPARGVISVRRSGRGDEYLWRWADGRELSFNHQGQLVQIKAASGEIVSLLYDPRGPLVRVTDPQGRSLHMNYLDRQSAARDDRYRGVQSIDSPVGRFSYAYGSAAPKGSTAPPRDLLANLVQVRYPEAGRGRQYHYEDAQHPTLLTGISIEGQGADGKPHSQRYATFGYNAAGQGVLSTHAGDAEKVALEFTRPGLSTITNSLGQKTTYRYAGAAGDVRLVEVRGAGCALCGVVNERYGYDAQGRLTDITRLDADGAPLQTLHTEIDQYGRPLSVSAASYRNGKPGTPQRQLRYAYAPATLAPPLLVARPSVVPGKEVVLTTSYNTQGQPLTVTESGWSPATASGTEPTPITRVTRYTYRLINGRSLLVQMDGPLANGPQATPADSDITQYEYDASGTWLVRTVAPGKLVTEIKERDAALRPSLVHNTDGARLVTSRLRYTHDGQLQTVTQRASLINGVGAALERSTVFQYDAGGRLAAVGSAGEPVLRTVYDAAGRVEAYVDPKGNRISQRQDGEGKLIARIAQDRQGNLLGGLLNLWDDQNRLRARLHPAGVSTALGFSSRAGETVEIDGNGDASAATSHNGRLDILAADDSARRMWSAPGALVIADGANRLHGIFQDDFGRTVVERAPDEGLLVWAYRDGVVEKRHTGKDGRQAVTERLELLADGRLQRRVRNGCSETFHYDGQLLSALEGCGQRYTYARDAFGQLLLQEQRIDRQGAAALVFRSSYVYDDHSGRLNQRVLPDGQRLRYRYDAVDGSAAGIDRDSGWLAWTERRVSVALARWLRDALPSGMTSQALITEVAWRPFGGVASVTAANGLRTGLQFDSAGRVSALTVAAGQDVPLEQLDFRYDGAGNVVQRGRNGAAQRYQYDAMRRLRAERGVMPAALQVSYRYDALGSRLAAAPDYDTFGRQRSKGEQSFRYNEQHQLVAVQAGGAEVASYRYDALGNRIAKTVRGQTTYYVYDAAHQLVAEADQHGNWTRQYLYIDGRPVLLMQAEGAVQTRAVYAVHADQRGLPLAVTDAQQRVVWRQDFDAFGNLRQEPLRRASLGDANVVQMNLRMAGQYADAETGLYYNIHRYYDPQQGRYLTPDPLGLEGGEHSYAYVKGNPLSGTDPLGLFHIPGQFFTGNNPLNDHWDIKLDGGHGDIVRIAFAQYLRGSGQQGRFSQHFVEWVIRNNYHSDVNGSFSCYPVGWTSGGGQCNPRNHFDNPNDGPEYDKQGGKLMPSYTDGAHDHWIQEALDQVIDNRRFYQTMTQGNDLNISRLLSAFGQNSHALADFYAHSNWVDGVDRGGCVDNVAKDSITQEHGWIPVGLNKATLWDEHDSELLFSGTVAGRGAYCTGLTGDISCADETTHGYWNKDGIDTPAGTQEVGNLVLNGWLAEAYDPDNAPKTEYGKYWYGDNGVAQKDLKKGDYIYRAYQIRRKHQLAFYLAIEQTKREIATLYNGAGNAMANGKKLQDVFKMNREQMNNNHIIYSDNFTKEQR